MDEIGSVLVVRRDNIGDLVCTTPLLAALRANLPRARIAVLANSYNAPVLAGNPHIDQVHAYTKLKHVEGEGTALGVLAHRAGLLWRLRSSKPDVVVIAGEEDKRAERTAFLIGPRRVVRSERYREGSHEVERVFSAARGFGITGPIPALCVIPEAHAVAKVREAVTRAGLAKAKPMIGLHISARRPAQRWPARRFAELSKALARRYGASTMLFWSPGEEDHAQHPGDDGKARTILREVGEGGALLQWRTSNLADLIAGLSACDAVICSDGGAMHIAAGLGKPIVCFFGDSPVDRWRPWGVPHIVLQAPSRNVGDITPDQALEAASSLLGRQSASP